MRNPNVGTILNAAGKTPEEIVERINQLPDWTEFETRHARAIKDPDAGMIRIQAKAGDPMGSFTPIEAFATRIVRVDMQKILHGSVWKIAHVPEEK